MGLDVSGVRVMV